MTKEKEGVRDREKNGGRERGWKGGKEEEVRVEKTDLKTVVPAEVGS